MKTPEVMFIDFDDTLFIWNSDVDCAHYDDKFHILEGSMDYNKLGFWNENLIANISKLKKRGIPIFLLTHVASSIEMQHKKKVLNETFPNLFDEYYGTSSRKEKTAVALAIAHAYKFEPNQICIVDDSWEVREFAALDGISTRTPMELMVSVDWE